MSTPEELVERIYLLVDEALAIAQSEGTRSAPTLERVRVELLVLRDLLHNPPEIADEVTTPEQALPYLESAAQGMPVPGADIHISDFGPQFVTSGFYDLELRNGRHHRWTGNSKKSVIVLEDPEGDLAWVGLSGKTVTETQTKSSATFMIDGRLVPHACKVVGHRMSFWIQVPRRKGRHELTIYFDENVVPASIGIGKDQRKLGLQISQVVCIRSTEPQIRWTPSMLESTVTETHKVVRESSFVSEPTNGSETPYNHGVELNYGRDAASALPNSGDVRQRVEDWLRKKSRVSSK